MQVRPRAAPRRAAQADDLPGLDPLVGFDHALRKVPVVGLQPVVVADDDQVAVAALVIFRNTHAAAERGVDRVARLERQVDALMLAPPPRAVFAARVHRTLVGAVVARDRVHQVDDHRFGHRRHVHLLVGEERCRIPVFLEDGAVLGYLAVADVFPRVVAVKHHLYGVVARVERVDGHHVVGVENRLDLLGLEPQAHCDDGVYGRSLPGREGCDVQRIGFAFGLRRCGRCRECRNGGHIGEAVFFHLYFIVVG